MVSFSSSNRTEQDGGGWECSERREKQGWASRVSRLEMNENHEGCGGIGFEIPGSCTSFENMLPAPFMFHIMDKNYPSLLN